MAALAIPVGSEDHIQGDPKAACTLLEYGDYECPHCGKAVPLVRELQAKFGQRLRFVFRNFPLTRIHANAQTAAEVAEFAASKGQFWPMHDLLLDNQTRLGDDLYAELAEELSLDFEALRSALAAEAFSGRVRADFLGGVRSGVNGTPTFYMDGERYDGARDYDSMAAAIEKALTDSL